MNRRDSARIPRRLVVAYELQGSRCTGITRDIGLNGFFVLASRLPPPGARIRAWITPPDGGPALEVTGRVTRARRMAAASAGTLAGGFGVSVDPQAEYRCLVGSFTGVARDAAAMQQATGRSADGAESHPASLA